MNFENGKKYPEKLNNDYTYDDWTVNSELYYGHSDLGLLLNFNPKEESKKRRKYKIS